MSTVRSNTYTHFFLIHLIFVIFLDSTAGLPYRFSEIKNTCFFLRSFYTYWFTSMCTMLMLPWAYFVSLFKHNITLLELIHTPYP